MARGGAQPGERRGGRQKGAANRRSQDLIDQLEAIGLDPVRELAEALQAAKDVADLPNWINAAKALLPYLYPRRRAVDITSNAGPMQLVINTGVPTDPPTESDEMPSDVAELMAQARRELDA